jgi:tellurite resistance protein
MDMALEYKEMMCRIASAVANAKGELTAKEIKWLSQLSKY